jgi:signal transduction histidine kinase
MMGPIQETARLGNVAKLKSFSERWIREQLQLADVRLVLNENASGESAGPVLPENAAAQNSQDARRTTSDRFSIQHAGRVLGELRVAAHGAMLSGETLAALEYLCEQFPAALDLCRLIEEKLHLERELAERERLAVLGQMAASISHNLKNPLGSIKTILQVQMESADLPASIRTETKMVLEEINRLSATLSQLLKFSRPTVFGDYTQLASDARAVLDEVIALLRHEADRRGINLHLHAPPESIHVSASREATHDILSNLILNALEATPSGGNVAITMQSTNGFCEVVVDDDGPGIPAELQQKVLQPFFTTKTQGTGLGLTIVARRIAEASGTLEFHSPRENSRGTRCVVTLRRPP